MSFAILKKGKFFRWLIGINKQVRVNVSILITIFCLAVPASALACPPLASYYSPSAQESANLLSQLQDIMPECLESAEYFALVGAVQLDARLLSVALESLERALLLDPSNGAAQVDYAQALFLAGQLFPALQINQTLIQREDLPAGLLDMLQARQQLWQSQTRNKGLIAEFATGYDNNLNGAPTHSEITFTLSGEPITLTLDPEFRPAEGPYVNLRLAGYYQRFEPEATHNWMVAVRNRASEFTETDLLQVEGRYQLTLPRLRNNWDLSLASSNLLYGGNPLYTVTEARSHFRFGGEGCKPSYQLAIQHQLYHEQAFLNGFETSVTGGVECRNASRQQTLAIEAGALANVALKADRPGDDRDGWKVQLNLQRAFGEGTVLAQYSYTMLKDDKGYSALIAEGAVRTVYNKLFRLQYARELRPQSFFHINLNYQSQNSNIRPFQNEGLAMDVGVSIAL